MITTLINNVTDAELTQLPPEQRCVAQLYLQRRMTYPDIATELNVPLGTVKSRISRARDKIALMRLEANIEASKQPVHPAENIGSITDQSRFARPLGEILKEGE